MKEKHTSNQADFYITRKRQIQRKTIKDKQNDEWKWNFTI